MSLTQITFTQKDPIYRTLAEELAKIVDKFTENTSVFQKEEVHNEGVCSYVSYVYSDFNISFDEAGTGTFRVVIHGKSASEKRAEEAKKTHDELFDFCEAYLKNLKIDLYLSVAFYKFRKNETEKDQCLSGSNFSDFTKRRDALPLNDELATLQEVARVLSVYFPIKYEGRVVACGNGKIQKIYDINLMDDHGTLKIGVYEDKLIATLGRKEDVRDLVKMKEKKTKELEQVKQDTIKKLKKVDSKLDYDGKNGLVFLGNKATITTEYDVFTQKYLMTFLKSKIKVSTLSELEEKIKQVITKKIK